MTITSHGRANTTDLRLTALDRNVWMARTLPCVEGMNQRLHRAGGDA